MHCALLVVIRTCTNIRHLTSGLRHQLLIFDYKFEIQVTWTSTSKCISLHAQTFHFTLKSIWQVSVTKDEGFVLRTLWFSFEIRDKTWWRTFVAIGFRNKITSHSEYNTHGGTDVMQNKKGPKKQSYPVSTATSKIRDIQSEIYKSHNKAVSTKSAVSCLQLKFD
jgi:hypothetical protein